jgi:hypothetical protein
VHRCASTSVVGANLRRLHTGRRDTSAHRVWAPLGKKQSFLLSLVLLNETRMPTPSSSTPALA